MRKTFSVYLKLVDAMPELMLLPPPPPVLKLVDAKPDVNPDPVLTLVPELNGLLLVTVVKMIGLLVRRGDEL